MAGDIVVANTNGHGYTPVAVYTQSSSLISEFTTMLNRNNSSILSHATIMAMDKMILDNPALVLMSLFQILTDENQCHFKD